MVVVIEVMVMATLVAKATAARTVMAICWITRASFKLTARVNPPAAPRQAARTKIAISQCKHATVGPDRRNPPTSRNNFPLDRRASHPHRKDTHQDRLRDRPFDAGATIGFRPKRCQLLRGSSGPREMSGASARRRSTICHRIETLLGENDADDD